jgi:hypothetical protein
MPTAILQDTSKKRDGNITLVPVTTTITHNNARLYHENGKTYYYVGTDASGNRIYRNTAKR